MGEPSTAGVQGGQAGRRPLTQAGGGAGVDMGDAGGPMGGDLRETAAIRRARRRRACATNAYRGRCRARLLGATSAGSLQGGKAGRRPPAQAGGAAGVDVGPRTARRRDCVTAELGANWIFMAETSRG